jgi:hypothetical protein
MPKFRKSTGRTSPIRGRGETASFMALALQNPPLHQGSHEPFGVRTEACAHLCSAGSLEIGTASSNPLRSANESVRILYFSSPQGFNDPFDCQVPPSFNDSARDLEKYAHRLAKEKFPTLSRLERRRRVRNIRPQLTGAHFEQIYRDWERKFLNETGILSLTTNNDHILMWSHYASGHTGVCLQFEYSPGREFFGLALPVSYADEFPDVTFTGIFNAPDQRTAMVQYGRLLFLHKSSHWSYEEEWRLVDFPNDGVRRYGPRSFPAKLLTAIILGCRMSEERKREICDLLSARSPRPIVYEAMKKDRQFALDMRRVS